MCISHYVTFNLKKKLIGFDINKEKIIEDKSNNNSLVAWILLGILGLIINLLINVFRKHFTKNKFDSM